MATITVQMLEGHERGHTYRDLPTPLTIGREEGNAIRLNDERVSRFHAKIQEDDGRIILTDLDSTNGTRINGHPVQMRVLQIGDQVSIGQCLLLYGSREQIASRANELSEGGATLGEHPGHTVALPQDGRPPEGQTLGANPGADGPPFPEDGCQQPLFPTGAPELPRGLSFLQRTQLSDLISYSHEQIRIVLEAAIANDGEGGAPESVQIDWTTWQRLLELEMNQAAYLRKLAEPESGESSVG